MTAAHLRAYAACTIGDCDRPQYARQRCLAHYKRDYWARRKQANGNVGHAESSPAIERLLARIVQTPGPLGTACWLSTFAPRRDGYTNVGVNGQNRLAHRVTYEHFVGAIPEDYEIDHLCRVPACCNPDHLEAVTPRINKLRSMAPSAIAARTNRCQRGHSLEDAYVYPDGRRCRSCQRERDRIRRGYAA